MSTIKDSFSKIKASNEFKDKLLRELKADSIRLNPPAKKIYYKPRIAVAAIFLILIGIISFKINAFEKGNNNSNSITYAKNVDSAIENAPLTEINSSNDISSQIAEADISSNKPEGNTPSKAIENTSSSNTNGVTRSSNSNKSNISSKINETTINNATVNDNIPPKTDTPITINNIPEKVYSTNSDNATNSDNETNSYSTTNSLNEALTSTNGIMTRDSNINADTSVNSVYIPKTQLPKATNFTTAKMLPLIVYKGNIYIYTSINISSENAKNLLGRKLGTTKGTIDDWSSQTNYSNEFASNIGVADVYAVNGYDENFRIMTNTKIEDGTSYPEFYECFNGITITKGSDVLEKLKLQDNIAKANFQTFNDWNNGTGIFYSINDSNLLNSLFDQIKKATPYLPKDVEDTLGDYRNDDSCKKLSFDLKDGSKNITLTILKSGYVYYGYPGVYLKIDTDFSKALWNKLIIEH